MKRELIIATRNKGKFAEIVAELKDLPLEFFSLDDRKEIPQDFSVQETASIRDLVKRLPKCLLKKKTG
jgi:inosine/xanthosine triphosphate pyrophosphatase family protein